jgi:hypothetical protein
MTNALLNADFRSANAACALGDQPLPVSTPGRIPAASI